MRPNWDELPGVLLTALVVGFVAWRLYRTVRKERR